MGAGSGPPNGACIIHHGADELLINRTPFLMERSLFLFRRGPSIPILCAVLFLT